MQQPGSSTFARFSCLATGVLLLLVLTSGSAFAQISGKVQGTVTDQDTGQPLVGAQIVVEGTNLGNVTNEDGFYFINNVPVGIQTFTAQYLGYQTLGQEERILAGQTMSVDFALSSEVIAAEGIVAVIEREPLVARDNTISKSRFTAEEVQGLPVQSLEDVIELGAGIYEYQGNPSIAGGFVIRGGRTTEAAVFVDGALVTDFATSSERTEVGGFGVEEVDVITGGFNAEFGHAQSGVVNIVTREGGREFHGNVRYTTDGQYGTDGFDDPSELGLAFDPATGVWDRVGNPDEEKCCGFNALQASFGGPIIPEMLTFFGSFEAEGSANFFPTSSGWNPAEMTFNSSGSTNTILPGDRGDRTRAQGKLTAFPTSTTKVSATYLYSRDQFENYHDLTFNGTSVGPFQWLSGDAQRDKTHDFIVGWDQELYQTAERSVNLQVRGNFHQTKTFIGVPLNRFTSATVALDPNFVASCGGADFDANDFCRDVIRGLEAGDSFEQDFLNYRLDDIEFFFEGAAPAQEELFTLPDNLRVNAPDPIFGVPFVFGSSNYDSGFTDRNERRYGVRVDLDSQLNRVHRLKVGGEYQWINLRDFNGLYTSGTFADKYDVDPRVGAAYAQDRLDYGDLVIDLGLRLDYWDPNTLFPERAGFVPCEISTFPQCRDPETDPLARIVEADSDIELSPRIGVAHPITDATQVRLSYGQFRQLPELRRFFDGFTTDFDAAAQNPNILYGNPNLDYIKTTAFEAGITHLISENLVLDVVGYNRDRNGAIRVDVFQTGTIDPANERRIATNGDNGNVKGFDLTLSKRYSNYWSTDVTWSLQFARGTTSSPIEFATTGGVGRLFDPLFPGRLLTPPTEILPETFDRLHTLNTQFSLRLPDDFREGSTAGTIFNNTAFYVIYNAHSGEPFTRRGTEGQGEPLEKLNHSRLPWFHQGDVRVTKAFSLGPGLDLELFSTIINVLDIDNTIDVNVSSGLPSVSGFEDLLSRSPTIPTNLRADGSEPNSFPLAVENVVEEFRNEVARQDLNGDGQITFEESQQAVRNAIQATGDGADFIAGNNGDSPFNYGEPRQYRFGVELRF